MQKRSVFSLFTKTCISILAVITLVTGSNAYAIKNPINPPVQNNTPKNVSASIGSYMSMPTTSFSNVIKNDIYGGDSNEVQADAVTKTLAVFLINYTDSTQNPFTPSEATEKIFNGNFANFFKQASYGDVVFGGDVYGWITEPKDSNECNFNTSASIMPGSALANFIAENSINLEAYDYTFLLHNCPDYPGFNGLTQPGTNIAAGMGSTWWYENLWSTFTPEQTGLERVMIHEVGHLFGLDHANGYDCGNTTIKDKITDCTKIETGNNFDIMGNSSYSLGLSAFARNALGWLPDEDVVTVTSSGVYTLKPVESRTGTRLIKITATAQDGTTIPTPYTLEYHAPVGFDKSLSQFSPFGLTLSRIDYGQTYILDANPSELSFDDDMKDYTLGKDASFSDPLYGLTISNVQKGGDGSISFSVDLATPTSCTASTTTSPVMSSYWSVKENNSQKGPNTVIWDDLSHITIPKSKVDLDRQMVYVQFNETNSNPYLCGTQAFTLTMTSPSPTLIYQNYTEYAGSYSKDLNVLANKYATQSFNIIIPKGTTAGTYTAVLTAKNTSSNVVSEPFIYTVTVE